MAWPKKQTSVGKDVEKLDPFYAVGGNAKWYSLYGKQHGSSLRTEHDDPAIPLLRTHPEELRTGAQTKSDPRLSKHNSQCTIPQMWKCLKYPSTKELINKCHIYTHTYINIYIIYLHTMEYDSVVKKNEALTQATNMDISTTEC